MRASRLVSGLGALITAGFLACGASAQIEPGSCVALGGVFFTALSNGMVNSTVSGSGTYGPYTTLAAPTSATWGGTCSGASTITSFTASANTWSASFSTPSTPCIGTITANWPGGASAISPIATISNVPVCSNELDFSVTCNSQYIPLVF